MSESLEGVPRYLNGVFIENILKKFECSEKVKLENYELKPVAKGGDHYSSVMGYEYYVIKLTKFKDIFIERGIELYEQSHEDINVLLHGDFWTNNMMFKYDHDGNPVDVLFMDYQLPYYSSPAIDILYFIHTSLKEDLRLEKQDELVQHYYKHLKETLIDGFKYDGKFPSLHEFQVIILKKSLQIFFSAFIIQPLMILDEKIKSNMFLLLDKNEKGMKFAEAMYSNPQVATAIKNLLPVLDAKGIFD
ncbi:hypothetical protein DMENIID0001_032380 [Sergentomyia squamirostris]